MHALRIRGRLKLDRKVYAVNALSSSLSFFENNIHVYRLIRKKSVP